MAYSLRYYKEFTHADGKVVRLEIHKKDSTAGAIEIGNVVQGLSLQIQGSQGDVDTPIVKTSLSMTFNDAYDLENGQKNGFWEEFYTPDSVLWKVIVKAKKAQETAFSTIWGGYVTPDSFSETLTYRGSVNIIARDNIGHMQDFPFDATGDEDGMISLFDLVTQAWAKIESPMDLLWNGLEWQECEGVIAYNTLMNVSAFEGLNWYEAVEKALYSYGAVMRYVGGNEVIVTTLRYMPYQGGNIDALPRIEPRFVTGATRELVPAVKRIEESVDYELEESVSQPQIKVSDFSGSTETYRCKIDGVDSGNGSFGTLEHDAPIWSINNTENWANTAGKSLFFNPHAYDIGYFSDRRRLGDEIKRFMYIAANNVDERSVSFSKTITCADLAIRMKFGLPVSLNNEVDRMTIEQQNVFNLKSIRYSVSLVQNGVTNYLASHGGWVVDKQEITTEFDTSSQSSDFECLIGMGEFIGQASLTFTIHKIEYAQMSYANLADYGLYACVQDLAIASPSTMSLLEKNAVNTNYQDGNNVILSRDPEIGPAYNTVALPAFIKNGIFYRDGGVIYPASRWAWVGGTPQQMAVYNHLQLLCYYAKPNNLISGTIVNADITRLACIYDWNRTEHLLISGTINLLRGHIEGATLREFTRYEYLWSDIEGATGFPASEQDSRSNVEGGASSSASPSTYTATQNVNIGTGGGGGGASYLGDLQDVDIEGVVAQSVLYYNGTSWVDMSFASLVNPLLNPYLKTEVASSTYATINALNGLGDRLTDAETNLNGNIEETRKNKNAIEALTTRVKAEEDITATYKSWWDDLKSLIVKDGTNNIKINGNLIVAGDTSTGGTGSNPEVAGTLIGIKVNGQTYDNPVNGILTIPDYPTSLEWSAINGKPTKLTEFTNDAGFITASSIPTSLPASDVYAWAKAATKPSYTKAEVGLGNVENKSSATIRGEITSANITNALGYTPLSTAGGTISSANGGALVIHRDTTDGSPVIKFSNKSGTLGYIGVSDKGNVSAWNSSLTSVYTLYHTGNFNPANYLPLSGGTMTGPIVVGDYTSLGVASDGNFYLGHPSYPVAIRSNGTTTINGNTLLHSGNIGSYAIKVDTSKGESTASADAGNFVGYGNDYYDSWKTVGPVLSFGYFGYYGQFQKRYNSEALYFRSNTNGTKSDWKTIAFTDSNVASATKLQTARTIWGQSFDGTGNVSGALSGVTNINSTLYINSSGNVLIGTTTDSGYKLDVNGSVRFGTGSGCNVWLNRASGNSYINAGDSIAITTGNSSENIAFELYANKSAKFYGAVTMSSTLSVGSNIRTDGYLQFTSLGDTTFTITSIENTASGLVIERARTSNSSSASIIPLIISQRGGGVAAKFDGNNFSVTGNTNVGGNLVVAGDTSTGSDIRFKDKLSDHRIALSDIAEAPLFTFKWNDREDDSVHLGSSAQYWEKVAPWLVKGEDFKTLDYSTLGVAIGISLANKAVNHEERIKILENKIKALEAENRRLRYGS